MFNHSQNNIADASVYSIAGQRIATLSSSSIIAGQHVVVWDGKDDEGENVSSGCYLIIIRFGAQKN